MGMTEGPKRPQMQGKHGQTKEIQAQKAKIKARKAKMKGNKAQKAKS